MAMITGEHKRAATIDLSELVEDFANIAGRKAAQQMVADIIRVKAIEIKRLAQRYAPVKTGKLQSSIEIKYARDYQWAEIYPTAPYAKYIEYGTGSRGEYPGTAYTITPKNAKALRFEVQGKVVYAKKVKHPGIRPQPFMRPAAIVGAEDFYEEIIKGSIDLIVNTPNAQAAKQRQASDKTHARYAPTPKKVTSEAA